VPSSISVRPVTAGDHAWVVGSLTRAWGGVTVARRGELLDASTFPGLLAELDEASAGLAVFAVRSDEYEVVSLATALEGRGVGRALLQACFEDARARGCRRVWLTTTNNNVRALAFYQRLGMDLCAFRRHGVEASRRVKPSIPLRDAAGIPIAHELDFELLVR
jgi:GNAT superfamily N-acetyltransferase